jgi:hypothetical protein
MTQRPKEAYQLEAVELRRGLWCVRPKDQLGTCGFYPKAWVASMVECLSEAEALRLAQRDFSEEFYV